ncbi:MAG: PAS domain S-box protein, partial [Methanosarcinaceae archaeon]|nr:PAS domain S-box protein [Methanosarcinaceae archaeon]
MERMHSLLQRQIKRYLGYRDSTPKEWDVFMNAVNDAYWQMDLDRQMLERSLELSSDELFEANSEMRTIFQAIPDLLFRLDGSGMILDCKAGAATDFISPPKNMIGKRIQDIQMKHIGDQFQDAINRLQMEGSIVSIEYSLILQEQEQFYEARLVPFLKDQIIAIIRNITERIQAEGERMRLVTAIEQSAEGIYLASTNWIIQYVNPAFERMTGYDKGEIVGQHTRLLKSERHDRAFYRNIRETLARGEVWSGRAIDRKKEGTLFDVEVTVSPVRDKSGAIINYVAIHRDISQIVKLEKQLNQAQKLEAVGTLAGGIAHDFNNLMMGILGYASLMMLDIDECHPHYEKLKAIETQVQSGADLTRQLLGVARTGRYEVKPTNLNELLQKTASLFGRTKKEIRIHEKYEVSPWNADCDRGQIEQVLLNLFVNAWQAMPGGGEIYLETSNVNLDESYTKPCSVVPGRYIKISVTDTGTGMDEKTRERIFDPFFTTKEMGRGTGLGLASAYGIVKGHAGLINVYSERGHGTTFNIYIP